MKKNGFTLMELLGVIVILSILAALVTPIIQGQLNKANDDLYQAQIENIKNAAKNWTADHPSMIPVSGSYKLTLNELQTGGYIAEEVKNPKTKRVLNGNNTYVMISYTNTNKLNYVVTMGE